MPSHMSRKVDDPARVYELAADRYALSPDGARIIRLRSDGYGKPIARGASPYRYLTINGTRYPIHEIAHLLRYGPDAEIPKSSKLPIDGDWSHVHPSNWREPMARGVAGRLAAARVRSAALHAGLAGDGLRIYARASDAVTLPQAWWLRCVAQWGDLSPDLSVSWAQAREHDGAARWWALVHYVADWCTNELRREEEEQRCRPEDARDTEGDITARVRAAGDATMRGVVRDPARWARVAARWLAQAPVAPGPGTTHHEQQSDAAEDLF